MPNPIKNHIFRNTFFLIILIELLSFLGYFYPLINSLAFFLIVILVIFLSLYRLEYGLGILLIELFIGSFGYLFYFSAGSSTISIRHALWLIIMSVWLQKTVASWIKAKKLSIKFLSFRYSAYLAVLSAFIFLGFLNGLINGNSAGNIFSDVDGWLYFLIFFPVFSTRQTENSLKIIKQIFFASITWLSLKTIMLAYFFSHNFNGFIIDLYRWVRQSGVGEITEVQAGFSRIFMQSHIFILIGFFILLFYLLKKIKLNDNKKFLNYPFGSLILSFCFLVLFLSAIIISFSRSYWLGLAVGGLAVCLLAIFKLKIKFKPLLIFNSIILLVIFFSLLLTLAALRFPYPVAYGGLDPAGLLSQRATQITNEAGASSRWLLLPALWQKIKISPILGQGFGTTVTYKTSDPRILASSPSGLYTTYAFEWGWLDVWLKLGLFGLLAYLAWLIKIIRDGIKINSFFSLSLITGLIVLTAVNIFSPYVNHPLGIGYLIITACLMDYLINNPEVI